jgi:hypothetical protein
MLALVARTEPGPFLPRTVELGGYLGIRHGERLIAMAGRRPEASAVARSSGAGRRRSAARLFRARPRPTRAAA